jgi:hypothetical protein
MKGHFHLQKLMHLLFLCLVCCCSIGAQSAVKDTVARKKGLDSIPAKTLNIDPLNYKIKNPLIAGPMSVVIPGTGQIYTGNYVKSGLIIAGEVILGLYASNRISYANSLKSIADSMENVFLNSSDTIRPNKDSTGKVIYDTTFHGIHNKLQYDFARFQEQEVRYLTYQCITWAAGLYYFNILDAVKNTGYFFDDKPRSPSTAGWLSMIPGLALGQLYNGSLDKAGWMTMVQINLAYEVLNYSALMRTCEDNLNLIQNPANRESKDTSASTLINSWNSKYNSAFHNRNTYLWYLLGCYLYGIVDAIVDAHLHDAGTKMKLEPDLSPELKRVGLTVSGEF